MQLLSERKFLITVYTKSFHFFSKKLCNRIICKITFQRLFKLFFLKRQNKKLVLWPNLVEELNPRNETVYGFFIFRAAIAPSMNSSLTMTF